MAYDLHMTDWLAAKFGVVVERVSSLGFKAYKAGDEDRSSYEMGSAWGAALDYASCYDGALFDTLTAIELGEMPALTQFRELVGA